MSRMNYDSVNNIVIDYASDIDRLKAGTAQLEAENAKYGAELEAMGYALQQARAAERTAREDLLDYLIGIAQKTQGAELWRALFAEMRHR